MASLFRVVKVRFKVEMEVGDQLFKAGVDIEMKMRADDHLVKVGVGLEAKVRVDDQPIKEAPSSLHNIKEALLKVDLAMDMGET